MSKLFLITRRWLMRDKKRTILTFVSIIVAVYLLSFVSTYLCTIFYSYRNMYFYFNPTNHGSIVCTGEQAETLSKNAAFDKTGWQSAANNILDKDFVEQYKDKCAGGDGSYFPLLTINGLDVYEKNIPHSIAYISGDYELMNAEADSTLCKGHLPEAAGQVAITPEVAKKLDLEIGDTIEIKQSAVKGSLNYTYYENGTEEKIQQDTDGSLIKILYNQFLMNFAEEYDDGFNNFTQLYSYAPEKKFTQMLPLTYDEILDGYADDEKPYLVGFTSTIEGDVLLFGMQNFSVDTSGEPETMLDYSAEVVGIYGSYSFNDGRDIIAYKDDPVMGKYFNSSSVTFLMRVKKGVDADRAINDAAKALGFDSFEVDRNVEVNGDTLLLEGRSFEFIANLGMIIAIAVVVLSLFIFLARLVINNAFEISASYRTEQYGALKTIGASDNQIFFMILMESGLYTLVALPVGFGLAFVTCKLILKQIIKVKYFDDLYGAGLTERFLQLDVTPLLLIIAGSISVFSIFFSAYADALRVKRMPPIQSVGYRTSKQRKAKKSRWISRRIFGYPFGFAVKSISRQRVRFLVTLLATVLSGVYFIAVTGIVDSFDLESMKNMKGSDFELTPFGYGYYDYMDGEDYIEPTYDEEEFDTAETGTKNTRQLYNTLSETGYFDNITINGFFSSYCGNDYAEQFYEQYTGMFTDEYNEVLNRNMYSKNIAHISVVPINKADYEKHVISDVSYEELQKSGTMVVANNVALWGTSTAEVKYFYPDVKFKEFIRDFNGYYGIADVDVFKSSEPLEMTFTHLKVDYDDIDENGMPKSYEISDTYKFAGTYTTDNNTFLSDVGAWCALCPVENYDILRSLMPGWRGQDPEALNRNLSVSLSCNPGCIRKAEVFLQNAFPSGDVYNIYAEKTSSIKLAQMIYIAGNAFAGVLIVVAMLNIFSTMNANMLNRRRDFSMMRSCGMSMRQVILSLFGESLIYGLVSALICGVVGWFITLFCLGVMVDGVTFGGISLAAPIVKSLAVLGIVILLMALSAAPALVQMKNSSIADEIRTA